MTQTSPLDELGALANDYRNLLLKKAGEDAKAFAIAEKHKTQKDALWPVCLSNLGEAIEKMNDRLSGTGSRLKVTNNNDEALSKRDDWSDGVEVLLLGGVFVNENWLIEVDKLGNVCVNAIKEDKRIFLLATAVARLGVAECSQEKWLEIFAPLVSNRIEKLMAY